MKIVHTKHFEKNFKKRIVPYPKLIKKFTKRFELFLLSSRNPILKDHSLKGTKKQLRAFSITGDIRIVYRIEKNIIYLIDIDTHNQVY